MLKKWLLVLLFSVSSGWSYAGSQQVLHDYHLTTYLDVQGSVQEFELFTKLEDRETFFGVTCSGMSPFPLLQVVLFNDEVLSDVPHLVKVDYEIEGRTASHPVALQGVLKSVDNVDERSNKIRIELDAQKFHSMADMQQAYKNLLNDLMNGNELSLRISHQAFAAKTYQFSLNGLKPLLQPNEPLCH